MKKIKNFIHNKIIESKLKNENFVPIYTGDELIDFVYRKVGE